jgi:hypothetical protein
MDKNSADAKLEIYALVKEHFENKYCGF